MAKTVAKRRPVVRQKARPSANAPRRAITVQAKGAKSARKAAPPRPATKRSPAVSHAPARRPPLERDRRQLSEAERLDALRGADAHLLSSARAGHDELRAELKRHTESSPALTAGDVDADWQDAYAVGDETPGGDNPTPGQNRVDEIGKAMGISYRDGEELQGGDEVANRDQHRWELDPASSDDWPHGAGAKPGAGGDKE